MPSSCEEERESCIFVAGAFGILHGDGARVCMIYQGGSFYVPLDLLGFSARPQEGELKA